MKNNALKNSLDWIKEKTKGRKVARVVKREIPNPPPLIDKLCTVPNSSPEGTIWQGRVLQKNMPRIYLTAAKFMVAGNRMQGIPYMNNLTNVDDWPPLPKAATFIPSAPSLICRKVLPARMRGRP